MYAVYIPIYLPLCWRACIYPVPTGAPCEPCGSHLSGGRTASEPTHTHMHTDRHIDRIVRKGIHIHIHIHIDIHRCAILCILSLKTGESKSCLHLKQLSASFTYCRVGVHLSKGALCCLRALSHSRHLTYTSIHA